MLGPLEVRRGAELVHVGGRKPAAILSALALHADQVVATSTLVEIVWPGEPPASAVKSLQAHVSRLRKLLRPELEIVSAPTGYRLALDPRQLDASKVEALAEEGRAAVAAGRPAEAAALLRSAEQLWRGRPYEGLEDCPQALFEVARLEELYRRIVQERLRAELAEGELDRVGELERLVAAHPLHEPFWGQLMVCLYRSGRQSDALRAYERVRQTLAVELGIEPGTELRALHAAVLVQDPDLVTYPPLEPAPEPVDAVDLPDGEVALLGAELADDVVIDDLDRLAAALGDVDEVLTGIVEASGGTMFRRRPVSWRAAFVDAAAAVDAAASVAIAVQERLGDAVPLRLAAHHGDVAVVAGEYVGVPVRQVDELLATLRHGGLVVSSAARAHGGDAAVTPGLQLVPTGAVLSGGLEVHRAVHEGVPDAVVLGARSAAQAMADAADLSSFVGRSAELEQLEASLAGSRLVTLCGPGGIGKTRLSLRAVAQMAPVSTTLAVVELAPVATDDGVARAVASALDVAEVAGEPVLDTVAKALGHRSAVILLDNCEHLVAAAARVAHDLLGRCTGLRILATSREPLGVPGEVVLRVPPLDVPPEELAALDALATTDSVRLLLDRAAATRPGFELTSGNAGAVVAICQRLDGIPLALELAAARLRHMSPHEVAERLDDRFSLLVTTGGTRVARHQTLRAAIDWSHDLLSADEKRLFAQLAVFAGGWTLPAAESVCGGELDRAEVLGLLGALVDKSLVVREERGFHSRYRMLETIRAYALERFAELPDADATRAAHFRWCASLAAQAGSHAQGPDEQAWLDKLEEERPNLGDALRWALDGGAPTGGAQLALALGHFWKVRCHVDEGARWLEAAAAAADNSSPGQRGRVLLALSELQVMSDHAEARETALAAVALAREAGDHLLLVDGLLELGLNLRVNGRLGDAAACVEEAVALARASGDGYRIAKAAGRLGDLQLARKEWDAAVPLLEESCAAFRGIGDEQAAAWALGSAGLAVANASSPERGTLMLEDAQRSLRAIPVPQGDAWCDTAIGFVALRTGRPLDAVARLESAVATLRRWGSPSDMHWTLEGLARGRSALGQVDLARATALESLSVAVETESDRNLVASLVCLARIEGDAGRTDIAFEIGSLATARAARLERDHEPVSSDDVDLLVRGARRQLGTEVVRRIERDTAQVAAAPAAELAAWVVERVDPARRSPETESA